jgi:phage gp36-like protein
MSYATVAELRARYLQEGTDPFASRSDAELGQALDGASGEIDSWRPQGEPSAAALMVLKDKCLTLARLLAYPDAALDETHPIVREALAVRAWLRALSTGAVQLPSSDVAASGPTAPQVAAPAVVFGSAWASRFNPP